MYGDKLLLSKAEAETLEERFREFQQRANQSSDPNRSAPEAGARVGGYNMLWLDRGDSAVSIDGKFRTSIITYPKNGRMPEMTKAGAARMQQLQDQWRLLWRSQDLAASQNTGTAMVAYNPGGAGRRHRTEAFGRALHFGFTLYSWAANAAAEFIQQP